MTPTPVNLRPEDMLLNQAFIKKLAACLLKKESLTTEFIQNQGPVFTQGYVVGAMEREINQRFIIDCALTLKDPIRSAILFRFFDNLSPRDIAAFYGVPIPIIHRRIRQGLEHLKNRLFAQFGNDAKKYYGALAPLAGKR